jgi:hypothetical protein
MHVRLVKVGSFQFGMYVHVPMYGPANLFSRRPYICIVRAYYFWC